MTRKGGELGSFATQIKENPCHREQKPKINICRGWAPPSDMAWEGEGGSDTGK